MIENKIHLEKVYITFQKRASEGYLKHYENMTEQNDAIKKINYLLVNIHRRRH